MIDIERIDMNKVQTKLFLVLDENDKMVSTVTFLSIREARDFIIGSYGDGFEKFHIVELVRVKG